MNKFKQTGVAGTIVCVGLVLAACGRKNEDGTGSAAEGTGEGGVKRKLGSAMIRTSKDTKEAAGEQGMPVISGRSIVLLEGSRSGPTVYTSGTGARVEGGLVRLGTLSGVPASASVEDISAVFQEFGAGTTLRGPQTKRNTPGLLAQVFHNSDAAAFNDKQVYVWVFSTETAEPSPGQEHGVFTPNDGKDSSRYPSIGWIFPRHTESGMLQRSIYLQALFQNLDDSITPGIAVEREAGGRLVLTPVAR